VIRVYLVAGIAVVSFAAGFLANGILHDAQEKDESLRQVKYLKEAIKKASNEAAELRERLDAQSRSKKIIIKKINKSDCIIDAHNVGLLNQAILLPATTK
jgi:hypothetical protein